MKARLLALVVAFLLAAACGSNDEQPTPADPTGHRTITVTSPAFKDGEAIPADYTCRGKGLSPELHWSGVPADSDVALVVDDPDAPHGDYVHWVVTSVSPALGGVDAGSPPPGAHEVDGTGGPGWTAPCPPSGTHHYRFTVYALPSDETFAVEGGSVTDFVSVLADEAVAWGRLTGTVSASGGDSGGGS